MSIHSQPINTSPPKRTHFMAIAHTTTTGTYIFTFIVAAIALYLIVHAAITQAHIILNDIQYGRPRTTHLQGFVGHDESNGQPSHFIAVNLQRQIVVLELPGSDPRKVRSFPGPYLFGTDQELTPVTMELQDINQDNLNDLLVTVHNERVVYLNENGTFRLPTPQEQAALVQEHNQ